MAKNTGLPQAKRMRHDSHFVDEITAPQHLGESIGQMIDIRRVAPNPHQPRKDFGDLSEMVASVKEKGILEPILVRSHDGQYEIIAGERRYQSALKAGLQRIPCIEVDVDHRGMLEISLIENLQRKDLTALEESAALQRLTDQFRYTHEEIARKLGKSRTVITEMLSLNRLPEEIQERCRQADINSKSMLLQIVRQRSADDMHRLIDRIIGDGMTREEARQFKRPAAGARRNRNFTFRYKPESADFQVTLTFKKPKVEREELIGALRAMLKNLTDDEPRTDGSSAPRSRSMEGRRGPSAQV